MENSPAEPCRNFQMNINQRRRGLFAFAKNRFYYVSEIAFELSTSTWPFRTTFDQQLPGKQEMSKRMSFIPTALRTMRPPPPTQLTSRNIVNQPRCEWRVRKLLIIKYDGKFLLLLFCFGLCQTKPRKRKERKTSGISIQGALPPQQQQKPSGSHNIAQSEEP